MIENVHEFHIPIMGLGYTVDSPLKVAKYGITSVLSIGDDILLEKLRKFHAEKNNKPYTEISIKDDDHRFRRVTAYLNLINELVKEDYTRVLAQDFETGIDVIKYFELLPENSPLKLLYSQFLNEKDLKLKELLKKELVSKMQCGAIDVNVMTKIDKVNYNKQKEPLPQEYNDAQASLKGFAMSDVEGSIVLSAGLNPRLYAFMGGFSDFFPNEKGKLKKKIILKVSDYRSAVIQGKFLAKKGLFVSEYRVESGLNCGGHAFATKGFLMGPILEEFKKGKKDLEELTYSMCLEAWNAGDKINKLLNSEVKITAQGGVGTYMEHKELLEYYNLDSVGWGTPFLLVPEAVNIDKQTLDMLLKAEEDDLYLSHTSPLGILFNTLRGNTKDWEKQQMINKNRPGSSCPKKFLSLNTEFTETAICTASRQYQNLKIKDLKMQNLPEKKLQKEISRVTERSCICVGLGTSALLVNDLDTKVEGKGVSICPGPNLAYFDKVMSLKEMVGHIYGRMNVLSDKYRPNMFIKELEMYVDYLKQELEDATLPLSNKQVAYFEGFKGNLLDGINYYNDLFSKWKLDSEAVKSKAKGELFKYEEIILNILLPEKLVTV